MTQNPDGQPADNNEALGEAGLEALKKEREARKALERELRDLKRAGMSEQEKMQDALSEYQQELRAEKVKNLRGQVAADMGLTPEQASFLPDTEDEAEMQAKADSLVEAFTPPSPTRRPRSSLIHPLEDDAKSESDLQSIADRIAGS